MTFGSKMTRSALTKAHALPPRNSKSGEPKINTGQLPTNSTERKELPIASGVLDYFPDALAAVAAVSWKGNQKHNPGEPLHWAREKSNDHPDCLIRHFLERGKMDDDGDRHSAKMVWRALAILQLEIEASGKNSARPMTKTASPPHSR